MFCNKVGDSSPGIPWWTHTQTRKQNVLGKWTPSDLEVVSCPDTTWEERVWWHLTNSSGFINVDCFMEWIFQPPITLQRTQSAVQQWKILGYFSTMTQHFFSAFAAMHTESYKSIMKPKESGPSCHRTLSLRVGSGHKTTWSPADVCKILTVYLSTKKRREEKRINWRLPSCHCDSVVTFDTNLSLITLGSTEACHGSKAEGTFVTMVVSLHPTDNLCMEGKQHVVLRTHT